MPEQPPPDPNIVDVHEPGDKAMAETRRRSSELMDGMISAVPLTGRFFGKFGFKNTGSLFTLDDTLSGMRKPFDNRTLLLTDEQTVGQNTVFTAITGAGPRQIKVENPDQIKMISQAIQNNLIPLEVGKTTDIREVEENERTKAQRTADSGIPLNEGILDLLGTSIQIETSVFSVANGSLIDNPPEQAVVDAMKRSMEKAKLTDSALINEGIIKKEQKQQVTIGSLSELLKSSLTLPSSAVPSGNPGPAA